MIIVIQVITRLIKNNDDNSKITTQYGEIIKITIHYCGIIKITTHYGEIINTTIHYGGMINITITLWWKYQYNHNIMVKS